MRYRTKAKLEGGELEISGDQWLIFLYEDYHCNISNPWNGIFHSKLLVNVSIICFVTPANHQFQVYKHVFTSPSSAEKEIKVTQSGNTHLHGMTSVTPTSITYIATQVCMS